MRLTEERAAEIVNNNIQKIYHIPAAYRDINGFLKNDLRKTLLSVYQYIKSHKLIFYRNRYAFFLSSSRLTYEVRKKSTGKSISSRHMSFLCAMGLFQKMPQDEKCMAEINKNFLRSAEWQLNPINVYWIREYDDSLLQEINYRAGILKAAGISPGNISYNFMWLRGLTDMAAEVFPHGYQAAAEKKIQEYCMLRQLMEWLTASHGYATKEQINDNLLYPDDEIEKILKIFNDDLRAVYDYKRPKKHQIEQYGLKNSRYIYMVREILKEEIE